MFIQKNKITIIAIKWEITNLKVIVDQAHHLYNVTIQRLIREDIYVQIDKPENSTKESKNLNIDQYYFTVMKMNWK